MSNFTIIVITLVLLLTSCNRNENIQADFYQHSSSNFPLKKANIQALKCQPISIDKIYEDTLNLEFHKKMLIKNATLEFSVKNYHESHKKIAKIINNANAYISSEKETNSKYKILNRMEIRVISDQFNSLLNSLSNNSLELEEKKIEVEDVTEEFYDIKTRLKTKKALEKRYMSILNKAKSVSDILEIEEKLGEVREEIESKEGRLKFLSHQVNYSTINLLFYQKKVIMPKPPVNYFEKVLISFMEGWKGFTEFLIALISIWPAIIIISTLIFFIFRFIRKVFKNRIKKPSL